jgi:hypothetical protein
MVSNVTDDVTRANKSVYRVLEPQILESSLLGLDTQFLTDTFSLVSQP